MESYRFAEFGVSKCEAKERSIPPFFTPPAAISAIRRGGYHEYVGLFINNGSASWTGFDLDTMEGVKVELYAGQFLEYGLGKASKGTKVRMGKGDGEVVEITTRKALDQTLLERLVALSNELWQLTFLFPHPATDIHNALFLIDGGLYKEFGGPGLLPDGAAEEIGNELAAIFREPGEEG
jgi:hypothetical protein